MKRLLFCLMALAMVMAMVVPCYSAEMKINGINRLKFISTDNMDGNKNLDDQRNFVKQRLRMYFTSIASENLKVVYKNEIDFNWGDASFTTGRGQGGGLGGDTINLETKNIYMEMMIPNTPVKATMGLQGVTLHRGWAISDDVAAARFDVNLDPFSVLGYWALASDTDQTGSKDDVWQLLFSGAYKAENMDGRLTFAYERGERATNNLKDNDFFLLMGDFGMSFDMVSFFLIAGINFGEVKPEVGQKADYEGFMFEGQVDFALDIATLYINFRYASGEKETKTDKIGFRGLSGMTYSWAEIPSDGYFWEVNSSMGQIGGANTPSNMWAIAGGVDVKPTDTTSIGVDLYYISLVEKREALLGTSKKDVGFEIDLDVTQKVYDNLDAKIVGAVFFADDGFGSSSASGIGNTVTGFNGSKDDAWVIGLGFNYKF